MHLINCEVNLILTSSKDCVITNSTGKGKFPITETKSFENENDRTSHSFYYLPEV